MSVTTPAILRRSPLQLASRLVNRRKLRVLAYHDVSDRSTFERQLDHLLHRYTPVSLDEVMASTAGTPLPQDAVLVTFDDGHRSWVDAVAPAMRSRGIPGVVFVVAGAVGSTTPYWWDEVVTLAGGDAAFVVGQMKRMPDDERLAWMDELRAAAPGPPVTDTHLMPDDLALLEDAGLEIGNHTMAHPILTNCDTARVTEEIRHAKKQLESIVGHAVRSFAYPNGDNNPKVRRAVAESGHEIAFAFDHRSEPVPVGDAMVVSRIRVNAHDPLDVFAIRVSGLHPAIHRLRGRA